MRFLIALLFLASLCSCTLSEMMGQERYVSAEFDIRVQILGDLGNGLYRARVSNPFTRKVKARVDCFFEESFVLPPQTSQTFIADLGSYPLGQAVRCEVTQWEFVR